MERANQRAAYTPNLETWAFSTKLFPLLPPPPPLPPQLLLRLPHRQPPSTGAVVVGPMTHETQRPLPSHPLTMLLPLSILPILPSRRLRWRCQIPRKSMRVDINGQLFLRVTRKAAVAGNGEEF